MTARDKRRGIVRQGRQDTVEIRQGCFIVASLHALDGVVGLEDRIVRVAGHQEVGLLQGSGEFLPLAQIPGCSRDGAECCPDRARRRSPAGSRHPPARPRREPMSASRRMPSTCVGLRCRKARAISSARKIRPSWMWSVTASSSRGRACSRLSLGERIVGCATELPAGGVQVREGLPAGNEGRVVPGGALEGRQRAGICRPACGGDGLLPARRGRSPAQPI